ncbi:hypothetical protein GH741_14545 [Aquibacillus halophilus]|uniref:Uncharacterized protein n=1 Tax=Aquibacillus halophilus TaxID=930132 RepID=A0A6A8DJE8_9BACI|nr:hypothetical protein [Aquibacillus halophilus]MRH43859.1 hypothetical protein [Aquibacillus halophilus]
MKRIYFRIKYNWHTLKFKKLKLRLERDVQQPSDSNLETQLSYHERSAIQCMFKF